MKFSYKIGGRAFKKKDMDVAFYTKEFQKLYLRSKVKKEESIKVASYLGGLRWSTHE